jgi:hypothetical protein
LALAVEDDAAAVANVRVGSIAHVEVREVWNGEALGKAERGREEGGILARGKGRKSEWGEVM